MSGTPSAGRVDGRRVAPLRSSLLPLVAALGILVRALPAGADILPPERRTVWNPGIPGGIPARTTICATVNASTYGNGASDATAGIQAAIDACPAGQVVRLSAGDFLVNGAFPIQISKGIVLRGAGPAATKLKKTTTSPNPLLLVGERWLEEAGSTNLTANAPKGATSVQVVSTAGLSVGQLVVLDETTDNAYVYWGIDGAVRPGGEGRGWFTRYDRPVGQMLEVASISGNTVSFTTPLHIAFDTAHTAQVTRYTIPYGAKFAGIEDLYVRGGQDDNITVRFAMYSWVKNVESDWSLGDSVALDSCFRCVLRDSYVHDTPNPYPGGDGYMLSLARYTADSLVENNIFINANKVMVMRASGGGNVIGYNYFDNGYIGNFLEWMETGLNASHLTCPHFELFEGNQSFNIDGDDTWGGAVDNTFFRNHATGKRRSYPDTASRRAIGLMYGHYYYSFVGNVLGTANQSAAPFSGFAYEDLWPWEDDPVGLWRIGYTPTDWNAPPDQRVVTTTHRHGNYDYATRTVRWASGFDQALPDSLYLTSKPAFFGANPWPWVDPVGTTKLFTLPARARYDGGNPNPVTQTLTVVRSGNGSGGVTSSPAGIDCGAACSASYTTGTVVTLTAAPAAGSTFSGWSGACSGTGSCLVSMNAATSVTATFALDSTASFVLTVAKAGTGSGRVTSSPAAIDCGATCEAIYPAGALVTLTVAPDAGSTFTGWSGDCSGAAACVVTMNAAKSVTATLTLVTTSGPDIAHWTLDDAAGLTAADSSGNGNTGTLVNGPAWTAGRGGQGLALDGVDDYVSVPHQAMLDAFPLSVSAWFKTSTSTGVKGLVNKYAAGSFNGYQIFFNAGDLCAWLLRDGSNYIYDGTDCTMRTSGYNDDQWHHVVFVAGTDGGRLYLDGVEKASQPWTGTAGAPSTLQELRLGHYPGVTGGASYLAGIVDEVRIIDHALTAAEVLSLFDDMPAPDDVPPLITGVSAASIGTTSATIGWTTDEPADSQVEYGPSTAYGSRTPLDAGLVLSHSLSVGGLASGTTYHYRVWSADAAGNLAGSGDFTFTTMATGAAPVISGVAASSVSSSGAVIGWSTDTPSDSQVEYGPTTAYGSVTVVNPSLVVAHSQAVTGLAPGTPYHYRVRSRDGAGRLAVSGDFTFTTTSGLLGYWKFDKGSGSSAVDSSGNGNTGTLVNGPVWTTGRSGKGLSFDGANDYVRVAHKAALDAFPLTVVAWVKTSTTVGLRGLVNKYAAGSFNGYQIFFSNGDLCAWLLRDNANYIYDGSECTMRTSGYNDNRWHQVVFVADRTGGRLYVDAVLKASQPWTGLAGPASTLQQLRVGHYPGVTGGGSYLGGLVDDVRIYDSALTASQVLQLYNAMPPLTP